MGPSEKINLFSTRNIWRHREALVAVFTLEMNKSSGRTNCLTICTSDVN